MCNFVKRTIQYMHTHARYMYVYMCVRLAAVPGGRYYRQYQGVHSTELSGRGKTEGRAGCVGESWRWWGREGCAPNSRKGNYDGRRGWVKGARRRQPEHSTAQRSIWQRNRDSRDRDMTVASTTTTTAAADSSSNAHRTTLTPSYTVTTNATQCTLLNLQCK